MQIFAQTNPAELVLATPTRHVIAATILFDRLITVWTFLTVFLKPLDSLTRRWTHEARMRKVAAVETILTQTSTRDGATADITLFDHADDATLAIKSCLDAALHRHSLVKRVLFLSDIVEQVGRHIDVENTCIIIVFAVLRRTRKRL